MPDDTDQLYCDPQIVQFYDLDNGWRDDFEYCIGLAKDAQSVLDLGCGTGQLAAALAGDRLVVGVDPASAMLNAGKKRPGGGKVKWVEGDARSLRLEQTFDLVILTGHAFQVFLTDEDRRQALNTVARHLTPGGRFIFDSRNPLVEEWREWTPEHSLHFLDHPELGKVKSWNDIAYDFETHIATYETHYESLADGKVWSASSRIAFPAKADIERMLSASGLTVDKWLGDWQGGACEATSPEMIPIGRLS
ncbi:methyltransferase domain-containing protein [Mesorhizobium sp. SB112]|uniref:class I SAM-dependent methyltransferase n=1 Tax=Mesorhizobium sp. SB112 TaxID=3151853 RepID=UPI003263ABBB